MSAPSQAGAVACDVLLPDGSPVARRVDIDYADHLLREYERSDCRKGNFLYPVPPAAVPVEALEGLVAKWKGRISQERTDDYHVALRDCYEQCADELTTIIKERSNG